MQLGPICGSLWTIWDELGTKLAPTLTQWEPTWPTLAPYWANLGPTWVNLGSTWSQLGPTWHQLGRTWDQLGPTWGPLGPTSAPFGPSWGQLEYDLAFLELNFTHLGDPACEHLLASHCIRLHCILDCMHFISITCLLFRRHVQCFYLIACLIFYYDF